jgi:large conductance mechanosensitive channel
VLKEFREFAVKGNMIDMAVGIIIGAAFGAVVQSLVENLFMPLISAILGAPDFGSMFWVLRNPKGDVYASVKAARDAGAVVLAVGLFINTVITFLGVALATFFLVKAINRLRRQAPAAAAAPPARSAEATLLAEIRDLLKRTPGR